MNVFVVSFSLPLLLCSLSCTARAPRRCIQFSFLSTKPEQVLKLVKLQRGGVAKGMTGGGDSLSKHELWRQKNEAQEEAEKAAQAKTRK